MFGLSPFTFHPIPTRRDAILRHGDTRTLDLGLAGRFPALQSRDFRLYWAGQSISMIGSAMQAAAIDWHIWRLTGSPMALGLTGLSRLVPIVFFSLIGGTVADARDRRKVLMLTQSLLIVVAAALALLTRVGHVSALAIYGLTACGAACMAFDNPTRQAMMPNLVPREHLVNAISLNSLTFRLGRILGALLAGLLISAGNLELTYAANAVSFLAVIAALVAIRTPLNSPGARPDVSWKALREGLVFVWSTPLIVWCIGLDFVATFFSSADTLLPVFTTNVLHLGASEYGVLRSASAIGTMIAGSIMTVMPPIRRQGMTILVSVVAYGAFTVLFGVSTAFWLTWFALAASGAADSVSAILRQTIRQTVTPDNMRGRMTAVNMVFFMGGPQLGELEAGAVANWIGAQWSVVTGGLACLATTVWAFARARELRTYVVEQENGPARPT